jgi:hypothetical protein
MDNIKFTNGELAAATFRLAVENNAFLRMMFQNQLIMMEKMGINIGDAKMIERLEVVENEMYPGSEIKKSELYVPLMIRVEMLSDLIQERTWQWVKMNHSTIDKPDK